MQRLDLFGSARGGSFDPSTSDIDLLVDFAPVETGALNQYMGLHKRLEELLGRKVDLIERKAVKNPYFILAVRDDRERLDAA